MSSWFWASLRSVLKMKTEAPLLSHDLLFLLTRMLMMSTSQTCDGVNQINIL